LNRGHAAYEHDAIPFSRTQLPSHFRSFFLFRQEVAAFFPFARFAHFRASDGSKKGFFCEFTRENSEYFYLEKKAAAHLKKRAG
jgi:hypothetical protein